MNDGEGRWNILQVLEHLNSYYAYYLPIDRNKNLQTPETQHHEQILRPVGLGAYFTKMMQPKDGAIRNKMKAFSNHIPPASLQASKVIEEFLQHQRKLIYLLELAKNKDINSIRIPISLNAIHQIKTGRYLQFYHCAQ